MKKIFVLSFLVFLSSCSSDLEDMNVDNKNATSAPAEAFFNLAIKNMSDLQSGITYGANGNPFNTTRILVQQISSVTYNEGATYYSNFDWENVYTDVLINLKQSAEILEASAEEGADPVLQNKMAMTEIMTVYTYAKLVEAFGDIPYSEALDIDNISPAFDDAQTVYFDLISRLNAAINSLDPNVEGYSQDILYDGDEAKWLKFANSLKLQMGMRIMDVAPELGAETVSAAAPGVFTSNADNATVEHLSSPPNTNELWTDLAVGNRRDFVGAESFVNLLNELEDPRREVFFQPVNGAYVGAPSGLVVAYADFSKFGTLFYEPTTSVIFLDYASVEFFLAEAAERGIAGISDAEAHYSAAIRASFDYYQVEGVEEYLAQPEVAYATASGDWKQKIGEQKWIALFNQGLEAWTEYRRLDQPSLVAPPGSYVDVVPVRLTYPISEQNLNRANYEAAAAAIGGDLLTTKLFWDVH